jgi:predicted house-cleaning NTP pyrophosphatase (Maf/HAM1 superfamily)
MPALSNPKHELFAQHLAKGLTQEKAYIAAGYKETPRSRMSACDLLRTKPYIKERVAELQSRNVAKADQIVEITTARLLQMAEDARMLAMQQNQPAAAVTALTAIAKLSGNWIERAETVNRNVDFDQLSDADLARILAEGAPASDKPDKSSMN